ncbi:hypothetical protein LJC60_06035, partial [Ruminococcaceae bacterium OttesenSCG-928-D13]|nr:hypothetical protein [Ruminococcaceae bacterium OttesenSCG-928-D13]
MENLRGINITIEICCSILCMCFVFAILVADSSKTKMNRAFVWVLLSNIAVMMSDTLAFYSIGRPGSFFRAANYVGNFFCFIFSYVIIIAFSYYVTLFFSSQGKISNASFYFVLASQGLAILLTILALFNDMYFTIDAHNIYHRQGWYWLSQMLGMAGMLANSLLI